MKSRRLVLVPAAALAFTACAAEETATPRTAPVTSATTTLAPETTVATTVPPETTTTAVDTTTTAPTTAPPTTQPEPPSGTPSADAAPIFAGSDLGAWLYIGRWTGSAWEGSFDEAGDAIVPEIASNGGVTISSAQATPADGESGPLAESCFDGRTGPVITPNAGAPDPPGFGYSAIATTAEWNLRPRQVADVDADIQAYVDAGVAAFASDDVETQAGEVDQIVVADLDGDGDTEALVVFGDESESEGDTVDPGFSGLLLIDTDTGEATTVAKSFIPLSFPEGETPVFDNYRVLDVADLNGDGLMEIVVHTWYYEGAGVDVYTYDGSSTTEVLSTGCGS
ncbi:hypothetical protein [Ilumatobacter coccineus]|uniref:VCBS repeat-containing protein n=1 Tax=Ilumatobacter coccineus (strain NBRC 103263 / KCTC 29153 / YM16-304) TaxID=1313172 RepID=A0A6C7EEY4_ILUCY|nr:hypothetical protein [Ilumatobacter coccineus]BAN02536.1 hypothetical protein YM304_22220 [Ilumatobacter coccineus YM16-304]